VKGRINEWLSKHVAKLAKDLINALVGMRMSEFFSLLFTIPPSLRRPTRYFIL